MSFSGRVLVSSRTFLVPSGQLSLTHSFLKRELADWKVKVTGMKLDSESHGLLHLLQDLAILKEVLPLSASSSRQSTEQWKAFCHTGHPSMRGQHSTLTEEIGFRVEHSDPRYRHPSPVQWYHWKAAVFLICFCKNQRFTCYSIGSQFWRAAGWRMMLMPRPARTSKTGRSSSQKYQ